MKRSLIFFLIYSMGMDLKDDGGTAEKYLFPNGFRDIKDEKDYVLAIH